MTHLGLFARTTAISALIALTATPVLAFPGKADRARTAIAEAQAKVDAANKVGAGGELPAGLAEAQAALATAKENLARGNKEEAFDDATHASQIADTAIGVTHKRQAEAADTQAANADATVSAAQQATLDAIQRAAAAQQSAAVANAQADALRNAPPPAAPAPTTTVTVEKDVKASSTPVKHVVTTRRVVHSAPTVAEKTTVSTSTSND